MSALKKDNMNVRISEDELDLIKRAAEACGKSLSGFVVEAATYSAQKTLMDQRFIHIDAEIFDSILETLSQPATVQPELLKLFRKPVKWATSPR